MASIKNTNSDTSLISKVSKIAKFIHVKVQLKAEYEGQIYTAKSLNEFRSMLFAYFKQKSTGKMTYQNLSVSLREDKKQGMVKFDASFERDNKNIFCKALFEWIKEKRWYIKRIDLFPCVPAGS